MSKKGTFDQQSQLPKLPLPKLKDTIDRYLVTVEPFALNQSEIDRCAKCAKALLHNKDVLECQAELQSLQENTTNWLEGMWTDAAYMTWRAALPINSNVAGYLLQSQRTPMSMLDGATVFTMGALLYHQRLCEEKIPVNTAGKNTPLCMNQYRNLFCLNRVPGSGKDYYERYPDAKHIVVLCGNRSYRVNVYEDDINGGGKLLISSKELRNQLNAIIQNAKERGLDPFPVNMLSNSERDTWYQSRQRLMKDERNVASLHVIESAIFHLSIDFQFFDSNEEHAKHVFTGTQCWVDKSFTFCVSGDGNLSSLIEHSPYDAPVPLDVYKQAVNYAEEEAKEGFPSLLEMKGNNNENNKGKCNEISFHLLKQDLENIREAQNFSQNAQMDSQLNLLECAGLGTSVWKQAKISPDAACQMALQLAYRRLHRGKLPVATYETIGMTHYLHGRTECCRVVSNDSEEFVKSALNGFLQTRRESDRQLCESKLRKACNAHLTYIKNGQKGHGVDRHLLGLKILLTQKGMTIPEFFTDPLFQRSGGSGFPMSTSNNGYLKRPWMGSFGSTLLDGYGIAYLPFEDYVLLSVESKKSSTITDGLQFAKLVNESLLDVAIICGVKIPKSML